MEARTGNLGDGELGAWPWLLRRPWVAALTVLLVSTLGWLASPFSSAGGPWSLPVDALPDLGENQQVVMVEWEGAGTEDVLRMGLQPLERAFSGMEGLETVRMDAMPGMGMAHLVFQDGWPSTTAREAILERLSRMDRRSLPVALSWELGPDADALGQVYAYTLEGRFADGSPAPTWDMGVLRTLQDETVGPALSRVAGVAEVAAIGGAKSVWMVELNPVALADNGFHPADVESALHRGQIDWIQVRAANGLRLSVPNTGLALHWPRFDSVMVTNAAGKAVPLLELAHVHLGPSHSHGLLDKSGAAAVGGIVTMRQGQNAMQVLQAIHREVDSLNAALPVRLLPGGRASRLQVVPYYDRSQLIGGAMGTLSHALWLELLITALVVALFALSLREAIAVAAVLPVAVLAALLGMRVLGIEANIVSLGGIAIAIGTMVDMGIILAENIARHQADAATGQERWWAVIRGTREVTSAIVSSAAITILGFLPVLTLQAEEGRLFAPLALTKTLALVAALVLTFVMIPVMSAVGRGKSRLRPPSRVQKAITLLSALLLMWLLAGEWAPLGPAHPQWANLLVTALLVCGLVGAFALLRMGYARLLGWSLRHKAVFLSIPLAASALGLVFWRGMPEALPALGRSFPGMGEAFMPTLHEGEFLFMPTADSIPPGGMRKLLALNDMAFAAIPEVETVVGKAGRAETAMDPAPMQMLETVIRYKPEWRRDADGNLQRFAVDASGEYVRDATGEPVPDPDGRPYRNWRPGIRSPDDIWAEVAKAGRIPGLSPASQMGPVQTRQVMLQSGIQAPMAVALRGEDRVALQALARRVAHVLALVEGVDRGSILPMAGAMAPRFTATAMDGFFAQSGWPGLMGGHRRLGLINVGGEPMPLELHLSMGGGRRAAPVGELPALDADGQRVSLAKLAGLEESSQPEMVQTEGGRLVQYVLFDHAEGASASDVAAAVERKLEEAQADGSLDLPSGSACEVVGSYQQDQRAKGRLGLILPVVLAFTFLILWLHFRGWQQALMVYAGVVVAIAGGFWMLWLYGQPWFMDFEWRGENMREVLGIHEMDLTVAVWVGFVALIGIATQDGIVMGTYLRQILADKAIDDRQKLHAAVLAAGRKRLKPCLMTTATTLLALLPVLSARGQGAELMAPMAVPIFGGMAMQLVTVFIVPTLFAGWQERRLRREGVHKAPDAPSRMRVMSWLGAGIAFVSLVVAGLWCLGKENGDLAPAGSAWVCPMDAEIVEDAPGKCAVCGMDLVGVDGGGRRANAYRGPFAMSAAARALAEVPTAPLQSDPSCEADGGDSLVVPASAVLWRGDSAYVVVRDPAGRPWGDRLQMVALGHVHGHAHMLHAPALAGAEAVAAAAFYPHLDWLWEVAAGRDTFPLVITPPSPKVDARWPRLDGLSPGQQQQYASLQTRHAAIGAALDAADADGAALAASHFLAILNAVDHASLPSAARALWSQSSPALHTMADAIAGTKLLGTQRAYFIDLGQ